MIRMLLIAWAVTLGAAGGLLLVVSLIVDWIAGAPKWTPMVYRSDRERSR